MGYDMHIIFITYLFSHSFNCYFILYIIILVIIIIIFIIIWFTCIPLTSSKKIIITASQERWYKHEEARPTHHQEGTGEAGFRSTHDNFTILCTIYHYFSMKEELHSYHFKVCFTVPLFIYIRLLLFSIFTF